MPPTYDGRPILILGDSAQVLFGAGMEQFELSVLDAYLAELPLPANYEHPLAADGQNARVKRERGEVGLGFRPHIEDGEARTHHKYLCWGNGTQPEAPS